MGPALDGQPSYIDPPTSGGINAKVHDFLLSNLKIWNEPLLCLMFNAQQVESIIDTPLSALVLEDHRIWQPSPSRLYTVCSACHLATLSIIDSSHLRVDVHWLHIWNLKIPSRVKLFLW